MTRFSWAAGGLLLVSIAAGSVSEAPRPIPTVFLGGYRVLAVDFHAHTFPLNFTTLAPWDIVLESRRQGLDAVAIAGHNHMWSAKLGRWFSRLIGGPTVVVADEVVSPHYHIIALGLQTSVNWNQPAAGVLDDIHRQGGLGIAAHPEPEFWPAFDAAAMQRLDGAEVLHPLVYTNSLRYEKMREFYQRKRMTAIGSSDFHGFGNPGFCRTFVFVRENSEAGIIQAVREGHTVVYDRYGQSYGDPDLMRLAARDTRLRDPGPAGANPGWLGIFSRFAGVLALLLLVGRPR